jgi:succinyl-diaminopimelate desuccinylase
MDDLLPAATRAAEHLTGDMAALNATPAFGSDATGYPQVVDTLTKALASVGLEAETIPVPRALLEHEWGSDLGRAAEYIPVRELRDRSIVYARIPGADPDAAAVHLTQHYDLPGFFAPAGAWASRAGDGVLAARGVNQCRSGVYSILVAAAVLAERVPAGDVHVSFTPDNHLGGETGAGHLVAEEIGRAPYVITGGASGVGGMILGYKGAAWIRVRVHGVAALASQPQSAVNAIDAMHAVQTAIADLAERVGARVSALPTKPADARAASLTSGRIVSAGVGFPETCTLYLDRRALPEESLDEAVTELRAVVERVAPELPGARLEVELLHAAESVAIERSARLVTTHAASVQRITGREPEAFVLPYYTEHRLFADGWGSEVLAYGPGDGSVSADADLVALEDIRDAAAAIASTVVALEERS